MDAKIVEQLGPSDFLDSQGDPLRFNYHQIGHRGEHLPPCKRPFRPFGQIAWRMNSHIRHCVGGSTGGKTVALKYFYWLAFVVCRPSRGQEIWRR